MTAGRPPKPTMAKILAGTYRPDRAVVDEPMPAPSALDPPPELRAAERRVWSEIAPKLIRHGLLTELDRGALGRFCAAKVEYETARRKIRSSGGAVLVVNGARQRNPWIRIRDDAAKTLAEIGREFGMSPAARPKLGRTARGDDPPPPRPADDGGPTLAELLASRPI